MMRAVPRIMLNTIGSVWFGVSMLVLVFVYSSIGSALPPVRQGAMADWLGLEFLRFEKTEMQWFCWWPFQVMIGLVCVSLVLATLRIKLNLINAGVWVIHTGMVMLAVASAVYFGTKVEGDAVIFHSKALVLAPGMTEPATFVVRPEASGRVGAEGHQYDIRVARIDPDYTIADGPARGEKSAAIWMSVVPIGTATRFARLLVLGYPDLTEDYLIESNGLVRLGDRVPGQRLLDGQLQIQLWYDPAEEFYVANTSAVYARLSSEQDWKQLRVDNMPHCFEYVDDPQSIWNAGAELRTRSLDLKPVERPERIHREEAGLEGIGIRVTGFLPYASDRSEWIDDAKDLNPLLQIRIKAPFAESTEELLARVRGENVTRLPTGQSIEFRWTDDASALSQMTVKPVPRLIVKVASARLDKAVPLTELENKGPVAIGDSGYSIAMRRKLPAGAGGTQSPAAVLVQVSKAGRQFNRVVFEGRGDGGLDLDANLNVIEQPADGDIQLSYADAWEDRLIIIGSNGDKDMVDALRTAPDGSFEHTRSKLGEPIRVTSGMSVVPERLMGHAREETRPAIVPVYERQPASLSREVFSQAHVEVSVGGWSQKVWLKFHDYAFPDSQRAQPGRFRYEPATVALPDGRQLELLYSRWREPLPSAVALDRFELKTYPGGDQPADYVSRVRFMENSEWSDITEVRSNHPVQHGDYWYFQSQYDPQTQSHTVLGVGNRVAVGWMLAGVCISIAGMLYAFYVKPALIRRRRSAATNPELAPMNPGSSEQRPLPVPEVATQS